MNSYKNLAIAATFAAIMLLILMSPAMTQGMMTLGNTPPTGRRFLPPLTADDTTHYLLFKNEQNNRYFLRVAIQRPQYRHAFLLVVRDTAPIKSVEVVAKAMTTQQKSVVLGRRLTTFFQAPRNPFRQYTVTWDILGDAYNRRSADDAVVEYDWISFDLELNFPASASRDEQRSFLFSMPGNVRLQGLVGQKIAAVPSGDDNEFFKSIYKLIP